MPTKTKTKHATSETLDEALSPKRRRATGRLGIGYIRVSRKNGRDKINDGESYHTEDWQRDRITALAAAAGVTIVGWEVDTDQSGKKWDRPGFQAALRACETGEASVVIVARFSRFARSVIDAHRAIEQIEGPDPKKPQGQLIAGDLNVDTTTPQGRMMRTIMAAIAAFELEVHTENWSEYRGRAIQNGVYARKAPVGYKRDAKKRLVVDKKPAGLVRELFKRRAAGASWSELLTWWKGAGGPPISRQGLTCILSNRTYLGEYVETAEFVIPNAHTPIVDAELFAAVQEKRVLRPARTARGSLLAGVLVCSSCNRPMTSSTSGSRSYRCQVHSSTERRCTGRLSVNMQLADEVVEAAFLEAAQAAKPAQGDPDDERELAEALAAQADAETELRAFISRASASRYPDMFEEGQLEREQALADADERVREIRQSGRVTSALVSVTEAWPTLDNSERRALLLTLIDRIVVHSGARVPGGAAPHDVKLAAVRDRLDIKWRR